MRITKLIYIILLPVVLLSSWRCSNNGSNLYYYHQAINYITDTTLYSHFPSDDLINKINVSVPCVNGSGLEIVIFMKYNNKEIEDFMKKNQELNKYSINDSCTNFYLSKYDSLALKHIDCIRSNPPVSNYMFWLSPHETMFSYEDIKDDLTYYIIESKAGKYLPDSLLTKSSTPPYKFVYNGFSRGYAVSKNASLITYWLIIW